MKKTKINKAMGTIYEDHEHSAKMNILIEQAEYNLFALLKPKLTKDGNQWCCIYGDDLQTGIAGFGDTPYQAILAWNKEWYKN